VITSKWHPILMRKETMAMEPQQFGFSFDADRCVQCHACELACECLNGVESGVKWIRLSSSWKGEYPHVWNRGVVEFGVNGEMPTCRLCIDHLAPGKNPPCVATCPSDALLWGTMDELTERAAKRSFAVTLFPVTNSFATSRP
jgi:Fe-S-cluster-containing dehydrogenase component